MTNTHPHPEWKRLAEEMLPIITDPLNVRELFFYEELTGMLGVDIRSTRGRTQFYRFRNHALKEWGIWFECDLNQGYHITKPTEHPTCAVARINRGKRQMKNALAITTLTNEDGASPEIIAAKRQISASIGAVMQAHKMESAKLKPLLRTVVMQLGSAAESLEAIKNLKKTE